MKLSTRMRYGTRLMLDLALNYNKGPIYLKAIARKEEISMKYLSQIVIPLKNAGLIDAVRGAKGGYNLASYPAKITVGDIYEVLEGGCGLVDCVDNKSKCDRVSTCVTRELWVNLSSKMFESLNKVTLQDLVTRYKNKQNETIMYNI